MIGSGQWSFISQGDTYMVPNISRLKSSPTHHLFSLPMPQGLPENQTDIETDKHKTSLTTA